MVDYNTIGAQTKEDNYLNEATKKANLLLLKASLCFFFFVITMSKFNVILNDKVFFSKFVVFNFTF